MGRSWKLAVLVLLLAAAGRAEARVMHSSPSGFLVGGEATVGAARDSVYRALVDHVAEWWDPAHTWSGDAGNLTLEAIPGGCFCEGLPGGGGVRHLEVVYVAPGELLRLTGALGPLQESGLAGSLTWSFTTSGDSTRVGLAYSVGGYMAGGIQELAPLVDAVLGSQLLRLKAWTETGKPDPR